MTRDDCPRPTAHAPDQNMTSDDGIIPCGAGGMRARRASVRVVYGRCRRCAGGVVGEVWGVVCVWWVVCAGCVLTWCARGVGWVVCAPDGVESAAYVLRAHHRAVNGK